MGFVLGNHRGLGLSATPIGPDGVGQREGAVTSGVSDITWD